MIEGIKKMQGEIFFSDSTIFRIIIGVLGMGLQVSGMKFDSNNSISWGYVLGSLLITLPAFFLSLRNKTVTIYDIAGDKLEKILLQVFQQYELKAEKRSEASEFLLSIGDSKTTMKLKQGTFRRDKWDLTIESYRIIPNLNLMLEDIQKAVEEESIPEMRYRGLWDMCMAAGICSGALWFYKFLF